MEDHLDTTDIRCVSLSSADSLLNTIIDETRYLLKAGLVVITIREPGSQRCQHISSSQITSAQVQSIQEIQETLLENIEASKQRYLVHKYSNPGPEHPDGDMDSKVVICAPLLWYSRVFGLLSVFDSLNPHEDQGHCCELVSFLAVLSSFAYKSAHLLAEAMVTAKDLADMIHSREDYSLAGDADAKHLIHSILRAQEQERARIARDLHDGTCQMIAGSLCEIRAAEECIVNQSLDKALGKLKTAKGILRSIESENRRIISGLHPPLLSLHGLLPAVKTLAATCQKRHNVHCHVQSSGEPIRFAEDAETVMFRIVQESLSNAVAHSQCSSISIELNYLSNSFVLCVQDDGAGFDPGNMFSLTDWGVGLIGMRERAHSVGGKLEIVSQVGRGTKVTVEIPLRQ